MDAGQIPWYLNWFLPDWAPFIEYAIKEVLRWIADNQVPIAIITNILTYLKILAIRNNRVKDDKILTWLIGFFTFQWLGKITAPIPPPAPAPGVTKANPIVLTEVVEEGDKEKIEQLTKEQREWMDIRLKEIQKQAGKPTEVTK
jgi:hypothetical protein